jgi:flavin reductase (DIM6/NTAB) family NADH-FMN oxidoreductase RutF
MANPVAQSAFSSASAGEKKCPPRGARRGYALCEQPKQGEQRMAIDETGFKKALSHFASGVTVVTTELEGKLFGMTVAAFASLSLSPPLVLVCIEKRVKSHDAIAAARKFGVSILGADQVEVSNRFASRSDDKFAGIEHRRGELGVPLLQGAITSLECRVTEQLEGGDHTIFVGEVMWAETREGAPLVYFRGGYREIR